ncbi:MAG: hypothetical protein EP344_04420 [Bacteroidetes bacterium]|nr:MAG: hypothetical protein EP344_04420 [Bacteroidota bacterium]
MGPAAGYLFSWYVTECSGTGRLAPQKNVVITSCTACTQYSSKPGKSGTMKKATLLSMGLLLLVLPLFSQKEKGVVPLETGMKTRTEAQQADATRPGVTRAVVIGISDYDDPDIPDLRYADRDADEFARFLQSARGGNILAENIRFLLNEQASYGQVGTALQWLLDESLEGDSVIIYFSGHGAMEAKVFNQLGYLLLWDSPAAVYIAGGALQVNILQGLISDLSVKKKAQVMVIADACRAGKMYSSDIIGAQLTTAELALQQANETKILSCQPDEFSIEGEQWDGGRGVFSYYLLKGLAGLADANRDLAVSLPEIEQYLAEHVALDVKPLSQTPLIRGDSNTIMAYVGQAILDSLEQNPDYVLPQLKPVEQRGLEQEILAKADSSVLKLYLAYQRAIEDKRLLNPASDCAEYYFLKLLQVKLIEPLYPALRRNYAAALIDDAQQVINRLIKSSPDEYERSSGYITAHYSNYPAQIERAVELLGPDHFMYATLMASKYWFEGVLARRQINCLCPSKETGNTALALHRKALELQPALAPAYLEMLCIYGYQLLNWDSAAYYAEKALEQVPEWELVFAWMSNLYLHHNHDMEEARKWLDRGLSVDSTSIPILMELSHWYARKGLEVEEEQTLGKILNTDALSSILLFKARRFVQKKQYAEAETAFLQAITMDSLRGSTYEVLLNFYSGTRQYEKVCALAKKGMLLKDHRWSYFRQEMLNAYLITNSVEEALTALDINPDDSIRAAETYTYLGTKLLQYEKNEEAKAAFAKAIALDPDNSFTYRNISRGYLFVENMEQALVYADKAIEKDSANAWALVTGAQVAFCAKQLEKARAYHKRSLDLRLPNLRYTYSLGFMYMLLDEFDQAEREFNECLNNSNAEFRFRANVIIMLSIINFKTGRIEEAQQYMQQASSRSIPIYNWAPTSACMWYFRMTEQYAEGEKFLLFIRQYAPNSLVLAFELTKILSAAGNYDQAFAYLQSAFEKGPPGIYPLHNEVHLRLLRQHVGKEKWAQLLDTYYPGM